MADLLIKGMKMPTCCDECDFNNIFSEFTYCRRLMQMAPLKGRLANCPLVEVLPVEDVVGHWQRSNPLTDTEECSICGYNILTDEFETPYCPWCGAKMDDVGGA